MFQLTKTKTKGKVKPKPKPPIEKELFDTKEPRPSYQIQLYDKPVSSQGFSLGFPGIAKRQPLDYTFKAIQDARARGIQKTDLLGRKTTTDFFDRTLTREAEKEIQRERTLYGELAIMKTKTGTISKTIQKARERQMTRTLEKMMPLQRTRQMTRQKTMQIQRSLFFTPHKFKIPELIIEVPKVPEKPKPPDTPKTFLTPKPKGKKEEEKERKKKKRAYEVWVKRFGKWKMLEAGLPRGLALKAGAKFSRKTLGATFKIKPMGLTKMKDIDFAPSREVFRSYRIVRGRRVPLVDTFIQRRGKRLMTGEERTAIQRARNAVAGVSRKEVLKSFGILRKKKNAKRRKKK